MTELTYGERVTNAVIAAIEERDRLRVEVGQLRQDLAAARATIDTMQGGYGRAAKMILDLRSDRAAARALLAEARATLPDMRHTERLCARIDAALK